MHLSLCAQVSILKKLHFATDGAHCRIHDWSKCRDPLIRGTQSQMIHAQCNLWLREPSGRWRQKDCNGQRTNKSSVRLCLIDMTKKLHPCYKMEVVGFRDRVFTKVLYTLFVNSSVSPKRYCVGMVVKMTIIMNVFHYQRQKTL